MPPTTAILLGMLLILLAIGLLQVILTAQRQRMNWRAAQGQCVVCGYDLRASIDRCPECGSAIPPTEPDPLMTAAFQTLAEEFSDDAREAIRLAHQEARQANCQRIGTAQLLLGILDEAQGPGARVLQACGIESRAIRTALEPLARPGADDQPRSRLPLEPSDSAIWAIYVAYEERRRRHDRCLNTAHLLLGLLLRPDRSMAKCLNRSALDGLVHRTRQTLDTGSRVGST